MINRVILIGNLGKDPEIRTLESGAMVAKFSVATNENYKDRNGEWQTQTEWHDVVAWRALAERAQSQLKKGMQVYVEGKLTHRTWQDQDGNNRRATEVLANSFRVLGGRRDEGDDLSRVSDAPEAYPQPAAMSEPVASAANDSTDDDLPF